ncbi:MAG: hypothetical protein QM796_09460 [Chthoniobacteraceae bacterium]
MMPFLWLHGFSYMIGTAICFWCGAQYLRGTRPAIPSALLIPLLCDVYIFAQALPFLAVPRGTPIRPMGWAVFSLLLALGLTVFGVIHVSLQLRTKQSRAFCAVGYFLSILPIPIVMSSLQLMAAIKGFELES